MVKCVGVTVRLRNSMTGELIPERQVGEQTALGEVTVGNNTPYTVEITVEPQGQDVVAELYVDGEYTGTFLAFPAAYATTSLSWQGWTSRDLRSCRQFVFKAVKHVDATPRSVPGASLASQPTPAPAAPPTPPLLGTVRVVVRQGTRVGTYVGPKPGATPGEGLTGAKSVGIVDGEKFFLKPSLSTAAGAEFTPRLPQTPYRWKSGLRVCALQIGYETLDTVLLRKRYRARTSARNDSRHTQRTSQGPVPERTPAQKHKVDGTAGYDVKISGSCDRVVRQRGQ